MQELTDVLYEVEDGLATITINRPERMNAFRARTIDELNHCMKRAWASGDVGVVCLTGAGDRAFCTGGDQKQRAETGDYGPSESGLFEVETLHRLIREIPKPVVAAVNGYAIGGGHVLHVLCDLSSPPTTRCSARPARASARSTRASAPPTSRAWSARSGRARSGSCAASTTRRRRSAGDSSTPSCRSRELRAEVRRWADEMLALSPTSLRFLKQSFNVDTEHLAGVGQLAFSGLGLFVGSEEAEEGLRAFTEKRPPDFARFRAAVSR